ncbi:uncharacterized protein LOC119084091 [Bradysia coprophila]|uniref:uncharacterized protein LOC119084091 n=1 Tax=Bradysia coprophila TaxID=38358 RepID=UPI00187D9112|nr:uncharacterized protein LOC119084091 [Bradysia coprophila]
MVYDRSDRWLYKPLVSYETDRLCRRLASTKAEVKFAPDTKESGSRSVSISHRSDGKNSCDYYYSRANNSGPQKNKTVIEKHCSIVDDGTMPYGWKSSFYDDEIWKLRSPFLRAHQLSIKPW